MRRYNSFTAILGHIKAPATLYCRFWTGQPGPVHNVPKAGFRGPAGSARPHNKGARDRHDNADVQRVDIETYISAMWTKAQ